MLLGTLCVSLVGNILASKQTNRAGEGVIRVGYGNKRQEWYKNNIKDKKQNKRHKNKMDF